MRRNLKNILILTILTLCVSTFINPLQADTKWQELKAGHGSNNSMIITLPDTVLEGKNMRMNHWDSCWKEGKGPDHCLVITK